MTDQPVSQANEVNGPLRDRRPNGTDLPTVKTSDLIYVFCAGAWVNSLSKVDPEATAYSGMYLVQLLALFSLAFALIPLEIYTGPLWQRVAALFDTNPSDDARVESRLARIDIVRLWALTMSFAFLNLSHPRTSALFVLFLGLFFYLNSRWNRVLFPQLNARSQGQAIGATAYDQLFDAYEEEVKRHHHDLATLDDHHLQRIARFRYWNFFVFLKLFPIVAIGLITLAIAFLVLLSWKTPSMAVASDWLEHNLSAVAVVIGLVTLAMQAGMKGKQIVEVSTTISVVLERREKEARDKDRRETRNVG